MPVVLCQAEAEFFRMLGRPVRIRVAGRSRADRTPVRDVPAARRNEWSAGLFPELREAEVSVR